MRMAQSIGKIRYWHVRRTDGRIGGKRHCERRVKRCILGLDQWPKMQTKSMSKVSNVDHVSHPPTNQPLTIPPNYYYIWKIIIDLFISSDLKICRQIANLKCDRHEDQYKRYLPKAWPTTFPRLTINPTNWPLSNYYYY